MSLEKLKELYVFIENTKHKLQQKKSISTYTASAALQNLLIENKDVKHQFISFNAYLMFFDQVMYPTKEFSNLSLQLEEAMSQCERKKKHYKDEKEKQEIMMQSLTQTNDISTSVIASENNLEATQEICKECNELSTRGKEVLNVFDGKCKTTDKAEFLEAEQLTMIEKMNKEMSQHIEMSKPSEGLLNKLNAILNSELMQVFEKCLAENDKLKSQSIVPSREALSGVKVIASQLDHDILEVFYVNTFFKKSSVEVKISYHLNNFTIGPSRGAIKHVSIGNCPVFIDDLIDQTVASNNFAIILPELQHRLSET